MAFSLPTGIDTASRGIRVVPANAIGKYAGLHMHFPTLADLISAVASERLNIAASNPMWAAGQVFTVGTEPYATMRVWTRATGGTAGQNAANSHARVVVLPSGIGITLPNDTNTNGGALAVPAGGVEGDLAVDYVNNKYWVNGPGGVWPAVGAAIFPGSGGGGGSALAVADEGTVRTAGATSINFTGAGVNASALGDAVTVTVPGVPAVTVLDEGSVVANANATSFNFVGAGVSASALNGAVTVSVAGGGVGSVDQTINRVSSEAGVSLALTATPPVSGAGAHASLVAANATLSGAAGGNVTVRSGGGAGAGVPGRVLLTTGGGGGSSIDIERSGVTMTGAGSSSLLGGGRYEVNLGGVAVGPAVQPEASFLLGTNDDFSKGGRFAVMADAGDVFVIDDVNLGAARIGFFGVTPAAKPTGVAVTAAAIHAALVSLGLIAA